MVNTPTYLLPTYYLHKYCTIKCEINMHYKESYPFQPIRLWFMPKSNILVTVDVIVFYDTW
jgi:hypothetical protein